jgi:hypothetical protein
MSEPDETFERAAELLRTSRNDDGGFGPVPGAPSEAEPTALAAIALDDAAARIRLEADQRPDGSLGVALGSVDNDSATALAAIAMEGRARERALDHLEATTAIRAEPSELVPFDPSFVGWAWTRGAFGWVEPTARALIAFRTLRASAAAAISDAVGVLRDRACVGGGWNYGNRIVFDEELPPYAHTTALGALALAGLDEPAREAALEVLRGLWREEAEGTLSLAVSVAALRANDDADLEPATAVLADRLRDDDPFLGDTVAAAWAAIATGPGLDRLVVST